MKIAMIIEWWYPIYGWGQTHVDYLSQIVVRDYDFQVDIFTRKIIWDNWKKYDTDEINDHGVRIIRVWPMSIFFNGYWRIVCLITMTFYLWYRARKEKYDIIHAHAVLPWIPAKIVWWLLCIPVIYTIHGTMFMDAKRKELSYYVEKLLTCGIRYDAEISVSSNILQYKNKNKNIHIIYNGVDLTKIQAITVDEKYTKLTFLTVARMDWQKNHKIILDAVLKIGVQFFRDHAIQFVRVGDSLEKDRLAKIVVDNNIWDIILFKWKLNYECTIQEYKKSHIFLLPSLWEGQPLTVLEAFACKIPILATDVWDNNFFVAKDKNGELFKAWDLENLILILKKYSWLDKNILQIMWNNGYSFVQEYSREKCVQKTMDCYRSVKPVK